MTSVSTQRVQLVNDSLVERVTQESEKVRRFERDTTHVMDSVRIETRNDTVFHTRWRTEYRDRVVERIDTIVQRDTIRVETFSQSVSSDSIFISERASPALEHDKYLLPSWCRRLLKWNIFAVIILFLLYLLRKQLLR